MLKLFVDDIRIPVGDDWTHAATVEHAQELIAQADQFVISLDHDLGEHAGKEITTRPLLLWCIEHGYTPVAAAVHSSNPVGAAWLEAALRHDFPHPIPRMEPPSCSA